MIKMSSIFDRPLLIYDNKCTSCIKFAKLATKTSRGWIRTIGHFDSVEIANIRKRIFPLNYDPTKMFWLINNKGIYGGRKALLPLLKEIIIGIFNTRRNNDDNFTLTCDYLDQHSCNKSINIIKRSFNLFRNGEHFSFKDH
ncbi:MAG: hypothetical protein ACE5SW_10485 [Nitrososphaeraceae archaeon]